MIAYLVLAAVPLAVAIPVGVLLLTRARRARLQAVYDQYGMQILNRVWDGPEYMPTLKELANPSLWYRRTSASPSAPPARPIRR